MSLFLTMISGRKPNLAVEDLILNFRDN